MRLLPRNLTKARNHILGEDTGAQLVEFAVSLPLLVVFVVGIFDFSGAYTLKQKLTNIARDAARAASIDPANDLKFPAGAIPVSVMDAFQIVDNYLLGNNINDCGISANSPGTGLIWTFTAAGNGCVPPGLKIIVNRGYYYPSTGGTLPVDCTKPQSVSNGQTAIISTCVNIQYAYPWRFGKVASLLGPATALPAQISATAVALNEN